MTNEASATPLRRSQVATRNARSGFSIIELIVVLIMAGIIAGMAVPRLNYEKYRADAAMRTVRTVLQGAQRNAIMRQTNMVIGFDSPNKRMIVVEDSNNNCVLDGGERMVSRPLEEGARFAVPAAGHGTTPGTAVSGTTLCTISGLPAIQFLRDGATSTDLDVYVASSRARPEDFRLIRVTMATGRTEAFRYNLSTSIWQRAN